MTQITDGQLRGKLDEYLHTLQKMQEELGIEANEFQKGYYSGFKDGGNAIILQAVELSSDTVKK